METILAFVSLLQGLESVPVIGPVIAPMLPWIAGLWIINVFVIAPSFPLPAKSAGFWWKFLYSLVNVSAGNFGHARNSTVKKGEP